MTSPTSERLQAQIRAAFADVPRPADAQLTQALSGEEYEEASAFFGKQREELGHAHLVQHREVLFWFSPEAFHYFLPAFLGQALSNEDADAIYVAPILQLLMEPENEFARVRWRRLTDVQNLALHAWLRWLHAQQSADSTTRAETEWAMALLERDAFRT